MTKVFNNLEELNQFLQGGKNISNIGFAGGMIQVTMGDEVPVSDNAPTPAPSLSEAIQEIEKAFAIKPSATPGKLNLYREDLEAIAVYCRIYPRPLGEAVVRNFFNKKSIPIYGMSTVDPLIAMLDK